jgi:hypothetical protein
VATLRVALHRWTLVGIAGWSLVMLVTETFKGGSVGNPRLCATDPTCGDVGWIPTAAWIGGALVILVLGYGLRPAGGPATTTRDKVVGLVVAVGVLVLVGVAFTLYQDNRPIA